MNVLADVGGQVGLWLGLTVISALEFLALAFKLATFAAQTGPASPLFTCKSSFTVNTFSGCRSLARLVKFA